MPKRLLLADDSVTIQRVIELTFADEDIQVVAVGDGQQAIDSIKENRPDIVLADTGMPERDGYQVAAFVKGDPALAGIPVVLLTGAFEPLDERRAQQIGCDGVLVKPFEPQLVISRVRELLDRAAAGAATQEAVPPSEVRPESPPPRSEAEDMSFPKPSRRESAGPAGAEPVAGNEMDDYFDQLDEAFASLETDGPKPAWPASERRDEDSGTVKEAVESAHDFGEWDLEALGHGGTSPGGASPVPLESSGTAESTTRAFVQEPLVPDPIGASEPASPFAVAAPFQEPVYRPVVPTPSPVSSPAAIPVIREQMESGPLANAFAALLAAEQGVPATGPAAAWALQAAPEMTDELVDDLARRVLERLTDRVIREAVSDAVGGVAERLVREEIERIKSGA